MNAPKTKPVVHLAWLDSIRGAAAIYVVCHHAILQVALVGGSHHDYLYQLLRVITYFGHYAVDIFIVLSGFSLMLPVIARQHFGSIWLFYLRRTIRIVLPYYAALILSILIVHFFVDDDGSRWSEALPINARTVVTHLFLVHQWFPDTATKINSVLWSVGVEYQIYFLFPLFYCLAKKFGYVKTFFTVTLLSYIVWGICYRYELLNPSPWGTSVYYCALFIMGMLAAYYAKKSNQENKILQKINQYADSCSKFALLGILMIAMFSFVLDRYTKAVLFPVQVQSFFVGLLFASWLYLKMRNHRNASRKSFVSYRLEILGTTAYSLYLLHEPVLGVIWQFVVKPLDLPFYWMQALVELAFGLLASIVIASVFYKWVELPCHRLSQTIK
jgi:peptidoglycan/LPS O-acetylase OafA/YrhL